MSSRVIQTLILKDWRLHRFEVVLSVAAGAGALAILQLKNETAFMVGTVFFFVSLIVLGSMLPVSNVINERKKQNLAFMMSLPVSGVHYAIAKMTSTVGLFLVPWGALVIAASTFVMSRSDIPKGIIPVMIILFAMPLVGFCLIAGTALVSESEGWTVGATIVCNSWYGLSWYFIIRNPAVNGDLKSPVPVWGSAVLTILAGEAAAIALILALTLYMQFRKREFV